VPIQSPEEIAKRLRTRGATPRSSRSPTSSLSKCGTRTALGLLISDQPRPLSVNALQRPIYP
jgi:hypothetical protein